MVGVLALLVFGPDKLPGMARSVGKTLNQIKTMASEAKSEFDMELKTTDAKSEAETVKSDVSNGDLGDGRPRPSTEPSSSGAEQAPTEVQPRASQEPVLSAKS